MAVTAVVVSALVGGFFGRSALATQDRVSERYKVFTAALAAVETQYVEEVPSDRLVYSAIQGMLQTLDPHSSFLDPRAYAQLRERQEGRYYGLGITIQVVDGDITVVSLFEGSPAYRKGVRRGDVIARIKGQDTKGWTSEKAVGELRGPRGTTVEIGLRRQGYDQLIALEVERDEITFPRSSGAFMIDDTTGYVRLRDFSETTDRDLGRSLDDLAGKGMKRLLLDLARQPRRAAGPGDQGVEPVPRPGRPDRLHARAGSQFRPGLPRDRGAYGQDACPIVVMVNRNSASAAEIVSGALQDHDRALVVGETTFGKALVQSIYRISQGAGLALTTARYYTPSGRLIQRPWDGTFDEYLTYSLRDQTEQQHARSRRPQVHRCRAEGVQRRRHRAGQARGRARRGLQSDPVRPQASMRGRCSPPLRSASRRRATRGPGPRARTGSSSSGASPSPTRWSTDFKEFLATEQIKVDADAFAKDEAFIRAMIKYDIDLALFGVEEARRRMIATDPQAQFALSQFPEAVKLSEMRRTVHGCP